MTAPISCGRHAILLAIAPLSPPLLPPSDILKLREEVDVDGEEDIEASMKSQHPTCSARNLLLEFCFSVCEINF